MNNIFIKARFCFLWMLFFGVTFHFVRCAQADILKSDRKGTILQMFQDRKFDAAEIEINRWKKEDKKSPLPYILAAQLQFEKGRYSKCLSQAQKAIDLSAQSADAYYWRARAFEKQEKHLEAANEMRAALLAKTEMPDAQDILSRIESSMKITDLNTSSQDPSVNSQVQ